MKMAIFVATKLVVFVFVVVFVVVLIEHEHGCLDWHSSSVTLGEAHCKQLRTA